MGQQIDFIHLFHGMDERTNAEFFDYHKNHPEVYEKFKAKTMEAIQRGFKNYGSKGIFELMRWESKGEKKSDGFKINNNFTPYYVRLFETHFPHYKGFFRKRKVKQEIG